MGCGNRDSIELKENERTKNHNTNAREIDTSARLRVLAINCGQSAEKCSRNLNGRNRIRTFAEGPGKQERDKVTEERDVIHSSWRDFAEIIFLLRWK